MTISNSQGPIDSDKTYIEDILDRAATQNITERELAVLVSTTRKLSIVRERELKRIRALLCDLESRTDTH